MESAEMPAAHCPYCGGYVDRVTVVHGSKSAAIEPKPGDVTLCIYCGGLLVFEQNRDLRLPTVREVLELKEQKEAWEKISFLRDKILERKLTPKCKKRI